MKDKEWPPEKDKEDFVIKTTTRHSCYVPGFRGVSRELQDLMRLEAALDKMDK